VDAVSHATVAEVAGCARSLVYRYFSQRQDIFYALLEAVRDARTKRITVDDVDQWLVGLTKVRGRRVPRVVRDYMDRIWPPDEWVPGPLEFRLAAVTLARDPRLPELIGSHADDQRHARDISFLQPLLRLDLTPRQANLVAEIMLTIEQQTCRAGLAGDLTRDEAIDQAVQLNARVLQTFVKG
jgi:AcrR family transcriptional regulator